MSLPDAGLAEAAAQLGLQLEENQLAQLRRYVEVLHRWNRVFNLTAVRDPSRVMTHHVLDCLAVVAPLSRRAPATLLDAGSGGGLPGLVIAIALPKLQVTCVDGVGKKSAFVSQVATELSLSNALAVHARVEKLTGSFDVVTSRAFASLSDFARCTRHLLRPQGAWMAMKGKLPTDELAGLPPDVEVFHVEQLNVPQLGAQRCLVWMKPALKLPSSLPT